MESFPFSMKFNCTLERPVDAVHNLLFEGEGKKKGMLTSSTCVYHFFPPSSPLSLSLSLSLERTPDVLHLSETTRFYDGVH